MKIFIQESAEQDLLNQVEWYAEEGVPDMGRRFYAAALAGIDALVAKAYVAPIRPTSNPLLEGLRSWPIKGFELFII